MYQWSPLTIDLITHLNSVTFFFYCYFRLLFLDVRIAAAPVQVMVMMVDMRWRHCAVVMTDIWWNH